MSDDKAVIQARLAAPSPQSSESISRHVQATNCLNGGKVSVFCSCYHCTLAVCSRCGAYEGGLTTHCPGERLDYATTRAVYDAGLDYLSNLGWYISADGKYTRSPLFEKDA